MALPNVITFQIGTGNATYIVNAAAATNAPLALATTIMPSFAQFGLQQRALVSSVGNDSGIFFRIVGLNQAGFTVTEFLAGTNATFAVSAQDYSKIISIQGSSSGTTLIPAATANSVSVGISTTGGTASTMWQIMNWHVSPTNIELSGVLQSGAATWTAQYTYDDPNNLPAGVFTPQPFNHPTLLNQTGSLDGPINDPVTAVRFLIAAGTGTMRFTVIQAGIGSP
jgi:hypothetical protein